MSVVRTVAGVTATAVKAASGVTAAGVRVAGGVAATAVKGAAVATTYATTKGDTESTQDPSAALRYTVKAAKGATKVALAATRTTANVAESAIGAVGTVAGKYAPIPSAIRDSDLALGLMEVAGAAVSGAASVVDATASASLRVTTATADAAGTVVGHKYGDKTGELVKDTLHIAVDIGETVGHIGKTQVVNLAPKVAQQFVAASVAANTPASETVAVKETSSGGVLATAGTVVSTAASTVSTIGTGVSVVGSTVVTGAKITATTVGAVGKGVMYTGAAVGTAATLVGGLASKMTSWATKKPTPAVDADKPQGGDAALLTTEEAQPPKP